MTLTLWAVDVVGPARWRWLLTTDTGRAVADHEVTLDPSMAEYEAFGDLYGYLRRSRLPHDPVGSEAEAVARVGAWIGAQVFGERLGAKLTGTVRVVVPPTARFLLSRPLELAHVDGTELARRGVSLVYELPRAATPDDDPWSDPWSDPFWPAHEKAPYGKEQVADRLRILALFSLPARTSVLALRRERYELEWTVRRIAAKSRKAIELRVLQYGVTRERLAEAAEEYPGWDVLHVSGHGGAGALLLEHANGDPDEVATADLVELLKPAADRLKLAVLSACSSGALVAASTLRNLGLADAAEKLEAAAGEVPATPVGLASGIVEELGVAALAMRYPVADTFAVALSGELYPRLLGAGQPVDRAVALALPRAAGQRPSTDRPALSIGTPALFGGTAVGLRVAPPPGTVKLDPYAERMAWFPEEPKRFVGRSRALIEGNAALAPESGRAGVLFVGMAGAGKTACALELAHQHRGRFGALAWWQAPTQPDGFEQALTGFAHAVETQLGIPMMHAVASAEALGNFLPRLTALLREEAVLLVLDNLDPLLSDAGTWRDPLWGQLLAGLVGHGGLSRLVLTSRVAPADLDASQMLTLPTHALSLAESVLLARELPNLGRLLHDEPAPQRSPVQVDADRSLARRVLTVVQGHPKLLELADAAAAGPDRLAAALSAAEAAGRDAPVTAFFATGTSDLDAGRYLEMLAAWTGAALAALPAPARTLAELLAHLDENDRLSVVVDRVWSEVWTQRHGGDAPPLETALEPLLAAAVAEAVTSDLDDPGSLRVYRMHPGVAEAVRADTDPDVAVVMDDLVSSWLSFLSEVGREQESGRSRGLGTSIVWVGLAAAPYLLRQRRWAEAADLIEAAVDRDGSPETCQRALGYLRQILGGETDPGMRVVYEGLYAQVLAAVDPAAAEVLLRTAVDVARERGQLDLASVSATELATLLRDQGDLSAALAAADEALELGRSAGFGPWTVISDECARLVILADLGRLDEVREQLDELLRRIDTLPTDRGPTERVQPQRVRELVLNTALDAAVSAHDWPAALDLNQQVKESYRQRGAPRQEQARMRLNDCAPLLGLGRYDEVERTLLGCQDVFEDTEDVELLGAVFLLRAELDSQRARLDDAIAMQQVALRYQYHHPRLDSLVASHDRLASFLHRAGQRPQEGMAHRIAAVILRAATSRRARGKTVINADDLRRYGEELIPDSLEELIDRVEQVPGIRFGATLAELVPGADDRAELFAEAVEPIRTGYTASLGYFESGSRQALHDALHRAADGERGDSLFAGLDEASTMIVQHYLTTVLQEEIDSISQEVNVAETAQPRDATAWAAALERAVALVRREPAAAEGVNLSKVADDLAAAYEDLGRYDDAIQAVDDAYDAGWELDFDVDIRVAGILLKAGRPREADELLAEARAEDPDDVTFQGTAGLVYFSRGYHEAALAWLTGALELALRTGNPDGYMRELLLIRDVVLTKALGRKTDEWQARGDAFLAALPIDRTDPPGPVEAG